MSPLERPRLAAFFAALFLAIGVYMPFFPLWLEWKGLDAAAIGLVLTAPMVARLVAMPFLGSLADRFATPTRPLQAFALGALLAIGALLFLDGAIAIAIAIGIAGAFWSTLIPVSDAVAVRVSRMGGPDYGKVRIFGSVAFIIANLGGGVLIGFLTDWAVLPLLCFAFAALFASTLALRLPPVEPHADAPARASLGGTRRFVVIALGAGLVQASHGFLYAFGSIAWETRGFAPAAIGALWATGVVAEIVLFRYGTRVLKRIGAVSLIAIGAAGAAIRWTLMAAEPGLAATFALQVLHGVSFGATHLGLVFFIGETVSPRRAGGAQSLAATIMGSVMAAATAVSGLLYAALGEAAFLPMAALAAAGLATVVLGRIGPFARRRAAQPQSAAGAGSSVEPS